MGKQEDKEVISLSKFTPNASFKTSMETLVTQTLRNAITKGAFYPGQELNETAIASDLQISRMPVRQAMSTLESEGLVTRVPRKGVFIAMLDQNDLEEIYTTRVALEEVAIRAAIPKYTDNDFEKIIDNLHTPKDKIATYASFLEIDREFHSLLYTPSGWKRVTQYIQQLRNNTSIYRIFKAPIAPEELVLSLNEHKNIFEACKNRNADLAAQILRNHTLRTMPKTIEIVKQQILKKP
jgi:DNA-binding GntR family transcriptional regulator